MIAPEIYSNLHLDTVSRVDTSIKQCNVPKVKNLYLPSVIMLLFLLFSYSVVSDSLTPWTAARQASLPLTISWSLLLDNEFTS